LSVDLLEQKKSVKVPLIPNTAIKPNDKYYSDLNYLYEITDPNTVDECRKSLGLESLCE